jgi:hypothetical protein
VDLLRILSLSSMASSSRVPQGKDMKMIRCLKIVCSSLLFATIPAAFEHWLSGKRGDMRRMGFLVFWAATLLTTLALPADSQNAGPYPIRKDIPPPVGLTPPAASYTGIAPGAFNTPVEPRKEAKPPGRGPVAPVWVVPPMYWPPLVDPSWQLNSVKPPAPPPAPPPPAAPSAPLALAVAEQQSIMAEQLEQLSAEVNRLRDSPAPPVPPQLPSQAAAPPRPSSPGAPLILILQNGQQLKLQSYGVMNQTLWDFSAQPARSIPISDINVTASQRATEAVGSEFPSLNPSH